MKYLINKYYVYESHRLINHYIKLSKTDNNDILNIRSYDNMIKSNQKKDFFDIIENNNNLLYHSIVN